MTVANLDDFRFYASGPVLCCGCSHSWVAVRPADMDVGLECPRCEAKLGASLAGLFNVAPALLGG